MNMLIYIVVPWFIQSLYQQVQQLLFDRGFRDASDMCNIKSSLLFLFLIMHFCFLNVFVFWFLMTSDMYNEGPIQCTQFFRRCAFIYLLFFERICTCFCADFTYGKQYLILVKFIAMPIYEQPTIEWALHTFPAFMFRQI